MKKTSSLRESNKIITKSNIPAQIFEIILKGINDTENMDTITMYDLMVVANELEFEELSEKLENHLIQSKASWLRTHFTFIYHVIFKHNKFENLKNFLSILKCDDLQINEKEIWDYVIKWGTAQNPTLPEKMEEWSDENIMTLKTFVIFTFQIQISPVKSIILPQRLALKEILAKVIEFYSLTNNPYVSQLLLRGIERTNEIIGGFNPLAWNKTKEGLIKTNKSFIFSFKGGNIQNSILSEVKNETYTLHDYDPTFGEYEFMMRSDVSDFTQDKKNQSLKEILAKVIEFYSLTNNPYVSQLLLRGIERTNEIIGGFNPLAWNKTKEGLIKTNKSFIFSFKGGNIQNSILSEVKNETYTLHDYDPTFGEYEFMMRSDVSDFTQDKKNQCYCYDRFSIIDYEVFKVVKKSF
ncbi:hypothetical protein Glove_493g29 [Diversispora epigaea]|uniref:TLDc domain-containing protein n=1 Tax=Diversispora epigaea TaxID=1348612 RepID=A0A397GNV3_9GLOM|nr:hypothetical protein Glove_493g29 [Diversispora epigaea]